MGGGAQEEDRTLRSLPMETAQSLGALTEEVNGEASVSRWSADVSSSPLNQSVTPVVGTAQSAAALPVHIPTGMLADSTELSCASGAPETADLVSVKACSTSAVAAVADTTGAGDTVGFWVKGLGFRVKGLGFRVWGLCFRVQGLGYAVPKNSGMALEEVGTFDCNTHPWHP